MGKELWLHETGFLTLRNRFPHHDETVGENIGFKNAQELEDMIFTITTIWKDLGFDF